MNDDPHNETLRAWVQSQQRLRAPEDFADRLLPGLVPATPGPSGGWRRVLMFARAAVFILAVAGGLFRYAVLLGCLFGS